jgi:hypothetical protein
VSGPGPVPIQCDRCLSVGVVVSLPSTGGLTAEQLCQARWDLDQERLRPFLAFAYLLRSLNAVSEETIARRLMDAVDAVKAAK